ncbi:hypothetical protein BLTE_21550 [Blastochloris tepida]|uniref:Uncharacterized protein n=1 Tax=Blastochloris tepida TaxID=2233851 RepID=A0A348G1N7_9HYPH|nr:hypothetical protein BLTE_21550 [Blastochloris tepida]
MWRAPGAERSSGGGVQLAPVTGAILQPGLSGFPASYEVVLSRSYVGCRGALVLLERIYTTVVSRSA